MWELLSFGEGLNCIRNIVKVPVILDSLNKLFLHRVLPEEEGWLIFNFLLGEDGLESHIALYAFSLKLFKEFDLSLEPATGHWLISEKVIII